MIDHVHTPADDDDICRYLRNVMKLPVTRHNWIKRSYGTDVPDPWTWDHEEELPETLRASFDNNGPPQPEARDYDH